MFVFQKGPRSRARSSLPYCSRPALACRADGSTDLSTDHPRADEPTAPLWPSRNNAAGTARRVNGTRCRWTGRGPSRWGPSTTRFSSLPWRPSGHLRARPATADVVRDSRRTVSTILRHTFVVLQLSVGTDSTASCRSGRGTAIYTLTLDVYGVIRSPEVGRGSREHAARATAAPVRPVDAGGDRCAAVRRRGEEEHTPASAAIPHQRSIDKLSAIISDRVAQNEYATLRESLWSILLILLSRLIPKIA